MKKLKYIICVLFLYSYSAWGYDYSFSAGVGASQLDSSSTKSASLMGVRYFDVSFFQVGGGLRLTHWSRQSDFRINSSFELSDFSINALNFVVLIEANLFSDFVLGFNIDAFGASFGKDTTLIGFTESAQPTKSNLLLGGKNDKGSLNSELYLGYQYLNHRWNIGWSHQVIEYNSTASGANKLQRFFDTFILRYDFFL